MQVSNTFRLWFYFICFKVIYNKYKLFFLNKTFVKFSSNTNKYHQQINPVFTLPYLPAPADGALFLAVAVGVGAEQHPVPSEANIPPEFTQCL